MHQVRAEAWGYLEVEEERERLKKGTSGGKERPSKKAGLPLPSRNGDIFTVSTNLSIWGEVLTQPRIPSGIHQI